jgi:hypothetical protein
MGPPGFKVSPLPLSQVQGFAGSRRNVMVARQPQKGAPAYLMVRLTR